MKQMQCAVLILMAAAGLVGTVTARAATAQTTAMPGEPVTGLFARPTRKGDPAHDLPADIRQLTAYGERPVFSPDGQRVAFVGKTYGDAYELDLRTGAIRNLTAHTPHGGIVRIHYMADGSYLLLAPLQLTASREETRNAHVQLWWMDARAEGQMIPLGVTAFEGIAVSPVSDIVVWAEILPRVTRLDPTITGSTTLKAAHVVVNGGVPHLAGSRDLLTKPWSDCLLEPQDLYANDSRLTLSCYVLARERQPGSGPLAASHVDTLDMVNLKTTRIPTPPGLYAEVEGVLPDDRRTTVECGNNDGTGLDICLLELKSVNPRYTRLTHALDFGGYRFSNPQVSRDGRRMVFQTGIANEEAGVGHGILMMTLPLGF